MEWVISILCIVMYLAIMVYSYKTVFVKWTDRSIFERAFFAAFWPTTVLVYIFGWLWQNCLYRFMK